MREYTTSFSTDVPVVTTTETVVMTLPAISTAVGNSVAICANFTFTTGTGTTAVTIRVRRGTTITDTLVGEANPLNYAAAVTRDLSFSVVDNPGELAGQPYVVTIQQTAATANGTALFGTGTITIAP